MPVKTRVLSGFLGAWVAAVAVPAASSSADIIYSDDFAVDPAATDTTGRVGFSTGWTESAGRGVFDVANGTVSLQSVATFSRSNDNTSPTATLDWAEITHTFSTVGYEGLQFELTAFQSGTQFEANYDRLLIAYSVDGGANFQTLLTDWGTLNSPITNQAAGSSGGTDGNTALSTTNLLSISDPAAENNPNFAIRIRAFYNAAAERYHVNSFSLEGTAIPEPATASLVALTAGTLLLRRNRRG